jgi:hypothetical protein
LQMACARLGDEVERATSFDDAREAATELSFAKDPVAVPYLERALVRKQLAPILILGLERIGDTTAVLALISQARMTTVDIPALARAALRKIQSETSDPALKRQIEDSIGGDHKS